MLKQARGDIAMKCSVLFSCILVSFMCEIYANDAESSKSDAEDQLTVSVSQGLMRGVFMKSSTGRQVASFRSIPYAKPPVEGLRFHDPIPAGSWDGVLDASKEGPKCIQYDSLLRSTVGQEDCLVLNVFTHDVNAKQLKPVMVFIHGGGFLMGSGNGETDMYGPKLFLDRDIVFVSMNYRLGPLGFLSTEDSEAPGNYGLLDQSLALKWVRENIGSFGGDPNSITIFGESAGGASVEYQVLSPLSKGLFDRAISQSGSSMCYWSLHPNIGEKSLKLASLLQCPTDSRQLLECLRAKSAIEIIKMGKTFQTWDAVDLVMTFGPRIDNEREFPFLPAHPRSMISAKNFNSVPYITGLNQNEGCLVLAPLLAKGGKGMKDLEKDPIKYLPFLLGMEHAENKAEVARKVMNLLDSDRPISKQLQTLEEMFSDTIMFKCIDESANLFRKFNDNPTYFYHYAHRGTLSLAMLMGAPPNVQLGVCHADELFVLFANDLLPGPVSADDKIISSLLIDLWTSFAGQGTPRSELAPEWLPMNAEERRYLHIDATNRVMTSENLPFHHRLPFWNQILDDSIVEDEKPLKNEL